MANGADWKSYFSQLEGQGYLCTADTKGVVNAAPFARPRVQPDGTWAFGLTDRRTGRNLAENPHALYLYDAGGYRGCRATLELDRFAEEGELLEQVRTSADHIVGPGAGAAVKRVAFFRVAAVRPLVGAGTPDAQER
ncbi:MAG: pyridoxamine 5'-phosphate oxidase family protein [Deltaproteobacteria bacterium]|nr:pyridoxamine 5'-phosphate oxidase family protein [Deltaproteobacteria bacterium]